MAGTFLRRWFGGTPSAPAADEARAEIDRLVAELPELREPFGWLRAILDDLVPTPGLVSSPLPTPEAAREKLLARVPLLRGEPIEVNAAEFARRWKRITAAIGNAPPGLGDVVKRGRLGLVAVAASLIGGEPLELPGFDPPLVATIARFVLFPGFVPLSDTAVSLRQGVPWDHGYCPVCGSGPLLGEFRGLNQSRFLRCGLCTASWEVPRQWCPACGNRDHETLGFLSKESEENRYRVATCDVCRGGIKMLSSLAALPPLMLLVADAATLHLDLAAADRGYTCPPAGAI
ncbi:MAG TPA: formate dehydrogenase accessory protein FdhE [Gemmataceae bacterium]|nr:formate dehydrogenase accessory protein FdhE [Gemmataceae bacterium]